MKKAILITVLAFASLISLAQVNLDSTAYKSYLVSVHTNQNSIEANAEILFFFSKGQMVSSISDQRKTLYFQSTPRKEVLSTGDTTMVIQCKDNGGFWCILNIGYIRKTNVYFISITYNNVIFFYECRKTTDRPWDNDPKPILAFEPWEETYTDAQIAEFIRSMGGNPETFKKAVIADLFFNVF